jgi:hypothetical protein
MMDEIIFVSSLTSFVVFCVAQIIVFRFVEEDRALVWLAKLFLLVEGISLLAGYVLWEQQVYRMVILWHGILFSLLVVSYILSLFSFSEASITLRLLSEIARGKDRGVTKETILARYNVGVVVNRRISRFLMNGELEEIQKGISYRWKNSVSLFIFREKVTKVFGILFPRRVS